MPRRSRFATGGYVFHVLNGAAGRQTLFKTAGDYWAFQKVLDEAQQQTPMRVLSYCIMPNHWHLVLWPEGDDDLSNYMRWLTVTHTQRWHAFHETSGTGPIYQGRFKSFPIEEDDHLVRVCRYVERNALRANLVELAEKWRWSSLWQRERERTDVTLAAWPVARSVDWRVYVNQPESEVELQALRNSVKRGSPFGSAQWQKETAASLGLEKTLRRRGRPRS